MVSLCRMAGGTQSTAVPGWNDCKDWGRKKIEEKVEKVPLKTLDLEDGERGKGEKDVGIVMSLTRAVSIIPATRSPA